MKCLVFSAYIIFMSTQAFADTDHGHNELPAGALYYAGKQPVGLVGDEKDCFVEAVFSPKGSRVDVRALVADPHDSSVLVGQGVVKANYSLEKKSYVFTSSTADAPVKEMILHAAAKKTAEGMGLTFFDEGHFDSVSCNNLTQAKDTSLSEIMEMFEHFDEYVEESEEPHDDHDHDHQH